MRATTVMLVALGAAVLGKWAHNKSISGKAVVEWGFALVVIALLDQGPTAGIARGFAWIFFAAVLLSDNSPITGIQKSLGRK